MIIPRTDQIEQLDANEYLDVVADAIRFRRPIPQPETRDQLVAIVEEFPEHGRQFRPAPAWAEFLGLSRHLGRQVPTWPIEAREEFLQTLIDDPAFAQAVRRALEVPA